MTTQYVQLNAAGTAVVAWYAGPQDAAGKPGYTTIDSADARFVAWQNAQAAAASFAAAIGAGVAVTSTGMPALDGTYALDQASLNTMTSEQVYIATKGTFTNGGATRNWPDRSGALHLFPSTAEFTLFAEAVAQYYDALLTALQTAQQNGTAWVAPAAPAALA